MAKATGQSIERVSGTVIGIPFRNDITGYTVCSVRPKGAGEKDFVTVVGNCAAVWQGEELHAEGTWTRHPQHGLQFQAKSITCIAPTSAEGIKRFLAGGMIKGIGPKFAERIVAKFGEKTLEIIDKESARLREVEGIGEGRRKLIKESWTEQAGIREIMIFLQSHGIGTGTASRIYRRYGVDSIAVVKRNPYRLCEEVWGIGFKTADSIALSLGVPHDGEERARAGLCYALQSDADEGGHCFDTEPDLLLHAQDTLKIPLETLATALEAECKRGSLIREDGRVYLRDLYFPEKRVAAKLKRLLAAKQNRKPIEPGAAIAWAEKKMGLTLAAKQWQAVANAVTNKVSIITGGPGVGKTTIIRALAEIFAARKLQVVLAAPTGRAAKRMGEATGREASTLHRLLKYNPQNNAFSFNEENNLHGDCFILDETSMMDVRLTDSFLQALPEDSSLVLVGDIDQLPSVGPGNVLRDLIASGAIPCVRLDAIYRQASSGLIVRNAHRVNKGEMFEARQGESDFYFIETGEPEKVVARTVELMTQRIPRKFGFDPFEEVQVLTPMRRNTLGCENLNDALQRSLNPSGPSLSRGATHFREGDRVMQLRNNYDKEVYNGDVGRVKKVDEEAGEMVVLFDGRPVLYQRNELDELVLSYACSIHKSQGSEYPAVIVLLHTQHFMLLQRNLLYTAITRARKLCIVVGSSKAVAIAVKTNQVRERRTTLRQRLSGEIA